MILWKQYSGRNIFGLFLTISGRFLLENIGSWQESAEKNRKIFRSEYYFYVPAISGVFLQDPVTFPHLSCRIRWPESSTWVFIYNGHNYHKYSFCIFFCLTCDKLINKFCNKYTKSFDLPDDLMLLPRF